MPVDKGTNLTLAKDNVAIAESLSKRNQSNRVPANVNRGARPTIDAELGTGFERGTGTGESAGGGEGIQSPVTETSANTRTFHPIPRAITSTDGVFTIEIRDLKTIDMLDDGDNEVQFVFAQPSES